MLKLLAFVCVTLAAGPALAVATPWQELTPGTRARLISSDTRTDGTVLAGLELDMPAGTKTYWRIPGETGIPTQFEFSAAPGLADPQVLWPYPLIDRSDGYLDYVYRGNLVLPLRLATKGDAATLDVTVTLGVCSDICVPARAQFSLPVEFAKPDAAQALRLDQAVAKTPIRWDQPGAPFADVSLAPDGKALIVRSPNPSIDPASLIADVGEPAVLFGTPQKSPDGAVWTLQLLGGAGGKGLEGRPVQLTFMTPMGPYAVIQTPTTGAR